MTEREKEIRKIVNNVALCALYYQQHIDSHNHVTKDFEFLLAELDALRAEFKSAKNTGCDATCLNYCLHEDKERMIDLQKERDYLKADRDAALRALRGEVGGPDDPGNLGVYANTLADERDQLKAENEDLKKWSNINTERVHDFIKEINKVHHQNQQLKAHNSHLDKEWKCSNSGLVEALEREQKLHDELNALKNIECQRYKNNVKLRERVAKLKEAIKKSEDVLGHSKPCNKADEKECDAGCWGARILREALAQDGEK